MSKLRYTDEFKPDPWRSMHTAPKDGTKIKLRLKDGYGVYQLKSPCQWKRGRWVNANTSTPITSEAIGWQPVRRYGGYDANE